MGPQAEQYEIQEALLRLLENDQTDRDRDRLVAWSKREPKAVQMYCDFVKDYAIMTIEVKSQFGSSGDTQFDKAVWDALQADQETAPGIEIPQEKPARELVSVVKRKKTVHKINKVSLYTILVSAAALLAMVLYVQYFFTPSGQEVATLTDSLNAQWAESSAPANHSRLATNHPPLMLRKGYAELVFDNDSKVVVEAPAEFQVISYDQVKLTYGRLYATIPHEAMGFIVSTPSSKIIDLGTEFGVQAEINGATELHVVKGKTSFVSGPEGNKTNIMVYADSAKRVTSNSLASVDIVCDKKMFVRQIDSKSDFVWRGQNVNLADIVGGGDGFGTGRLDRGVDPSTGHVIGSLLRTEVYSGPEDYIHILSNPYIDGVFVPGTGEEGTQIASTGLQTDAFPKTSGIVWGYIFDGAWHESDDTPHHHLQLGGVTLDGEKNPAITMHSNLGMTFDLSAIRETLPDVTIQSFSSVFGVSQTVEKSLKSRDFSDLEQTPEVEKLVTERRSTAEFWVFLDGEKVLHQTLSSASKAGEIDIPIDESVRFLTLAVTEADDTFMFDWGVFSRPELILESIRK